MTDDSRNKTDDDLMVEALASYLEDSTSREVALRELLERAHHNDPDKSVEDCLEELVKDYLLQSTGQN